MTFTVLEEAVQQAERAVHHVAGEDAGTTLTAMLWTGSRLALVHIGDSRAYLLREGELFRITHDHTIVQSMLDEGRITPEEATAHPQRSILLRALSGGSAQTAWELIDLANRSGGPDNVSCVIADVVAE
ncbi:hypothetical protein F8566_22895 [Actinomadura rudentiformis]|uniref:PPM-type phosphatase domain-containing protein n=1 Tax=Actinomadura rudentiformis TaxID=359158 RepID=A0A6H9YX46_9ACTN|nr:hypothetical protein F8566_22895 [Actinomadura rudentiformis]